MGGTSADRVRAWLDIAIRVLVLLVVLVVMLRPAGFAARLGELRDALRENGFSLALDIPGIGAIEERIEASTEALSELRSLNEREPFVRNLSTWCPNPTQTDPDYLICNP
jgi:hypothetical protein